MDPAPLYGSISIVDRATSQQTPCLPGSGARDRPDGTTHTSHPSSAGLSNLGRQGFVGLTQSLQIKAQHAGWLVLTAADHLPRVACFTNKAEMDGPARIPRVPKCMLHIRERHACKCESASAVLHFLILCISSCLAPHTPRHT